MSCGRPDPLRNEALGHSNCGATESVTPPPTPVPHRMNYYQLEYGVPSVELPDAEEVTRPTFGAAVP